MSARFLIALAVVSILMGVGAKAAADNKVPRMIGKNVKQIVDAFSPAFKTAANSIAEGVERGVDAAEEVLEAVEREFK